MMKRGFTLVELLVVVVVIAALTTIMFRLAGVGRDATKRSVTVARLQRIENALSGYYAAFGIYPPVSLQGSRNIYQRVDAYHPSVQLDAEDEGLSQDRVKAACKAQPFGAYFPFPGGRADWVRQCSEMIKEMVAKKVYGNTVEKNERLKTVLMTGFDDGVTVNPGRHNARSADWNGNDSVQLWKYGVMSYLLPRYSFMMQQSRDFNVQDFAQWTEYNKLPFDPDTGILYGNGKTAEGWTQMREDAGITGINTSKWKLEMIPSQAACMRWMPNFEGICAMNFDREFWGVKLKGGLETDSGTIHVYAPWAMEIFSPSRESTSQQYVLDVITVKDGWGNEFFYYSPSPHQSYRVWSAGANGKTFPPWVDLSSLKNDSERRTALEWAKDDIAGMKTN